MAVHAFPERAGHPRPHSADITLQRLPLRDAAPWQSDVITECRRLGTPCAAVFTTLKDAGLHSRCTLLAAAPGERLAFKFFGAPTVRFYGPGWARANLGRYHLEDPHRSVAAALALEYREALEFGPILNRVTIAGLSAAPLVYTHLLVGWRLETGHRAVLSCIEAPTLH